MFKMSERCIKFSKIRRYINTSFRRIGNTSITIFMKAYVDRMDNNDEIEVTNGLFTYVKIDDDRKPIAIFKDDKKTTKI